MVAAQEIFEKFARSGRSCSECNGEIETGITGRDGIHGGPPLGLYAARNPQSHQSLLARSDGDRRSKTFEAHNLPGILRSQFVNFLGKLRALLALDDFDVVLRLQIEPELRVDTKCQAQTNRGLS